MLPGESLFLNLPTFFLHSSFLQNLIFKDFYFKRKDTSSANAQASVWIALWEHIKEVLLIGRHISFYMLSIMRFTD